MKRVAILITFVMLCDYLQVSRATESHDTHGRLDVFHEVIEHHAEGNDSLTTAQLQAFIDGVIKQLKVKEHDSHEETEHDSHEETDDSHEHEHNSTCAKALCLHADELLPALGGNATGPVTEELFHHTSLVLLYYITKLDDVGGTEPNVTKLNLTEVKGHIKAKVTSGGDEDHVNITGVTALLSAIKDHISHEHHDHEGSEEGGDDDHMVESLPEDHHHDHSGHSHRRRRDTDHDGGPHDGHEEDSHEEDGHEEEEDHHEHRSLSNGILKEKCLSADAVMYYLGADSAGELDSARLDEMAAVIIFLIYEESDIEDRCRLLPYKEDFLVHLYKSFGAVGGSLSVEGLEKMMSKLGIGPKGDDHAEDSHDGHDHARKRRSTDEIIQRTKRQAPAQASQMMSTCYSARQLTALYETRTGVAQAAFQQLCPALVSQKLDAHCARAHESHSDHVSDAEKYGYGTLATFLICLCSVLGVLFVPCVASSFYKVLMSSMMGLAVGTLLADAVLHLIPMALGVHVHGEDDGHDHGSGDIVVEKFVQYGMAILAGLYFFYLLEAFMSRSGLGHSHGDDAEEIDFKSFTDLSTVSKEVETAGNGVKPKPSTDDGSGYIFAHERVDIKKDKNKSITPVALMIILGDALHNFADGLAIGAAFTTSVSTGIATSIAVFCHELPHEMGDFAVLLQSGLTFRRAVGFNLLSSLTAFVGLYVGLAVATSDEVRNWIFAIAAGMFIYIALVDVLPQLIKTKSNFHLALNNFGILAGFGIMFLIAVFEEHIKVD